MSKHLGIDVSHWQGESGLPVPHWQRLRECPVEFAIAKATQGTWMVDQTADENVRRARAVGMHVGLYHFLEHGQGAAQAAYFLAAARRINGGSLADLLLVVDVERVPPEGTPADDPRAADVRDFARAVSRAAPRNQLWVYSSEGYWSAIGNPDLSGLVDGLWQARWDGERHTCEAPALPPFPPHAGFGGWRSTPLWQYGSFKYQVASSMHSIDGDAFYGTDAALRALFTTKPRRPTPERSYRTGYNAALAELRMEAARLAPADGTAPGYRKGWKAATDDAARRLGRMRLGGQGRG